MDAFEEEYLRVQPTLQKWVSFLLFRKKLEVRAPENWIKKGPNIIIGNHCGAFKDVATIFRTVPRVIFFTANKDIFKQDDFNRLMLRHLKRHLKDFGPVLYMMVRPLRTALIRFVTSHITKVGTIPVDLEGGKREAMGLCQEYLEKGRAVIALQGRGRVQPRNPHPYVSHFRRGPAILAYNLYFEKGISVPVTPLAMHGTQAPWVVPGKIGINIGAPMFITDYLKADFDESVENFRSALEARVKTLFLELVRS